MALEHAIRAARGFASRQPLELAPEVEAECQQKSTAELNRKDDHFSRFAPINLGLIPVLIDIAANSDQNPTELREGVLSVLDVCQNQRESASDPLMWGIAIDTLEQVLNGTISISKARELNSEWSAPHREES